MQENTRIERKLQFSDMGLAQELYGPQCNNLTYLTELSGVEIACRGAEVVLRSESKESLEIVANCLAQLYGLLRTGYRLQPQDMDLAYRVLSKDPGADVKKLFKESVFVVSPKKTVAPKTPTQREYLDAIRENDLVFGIGPAGTGKTYLAVAMGVAALTARRVKRLVLTRPAVEAGEKLGFLPGDMLEKVNPYLRPLKDALNDMLDHRKVQEMIESDEIEIAPLAFMRGRTLNDAFIILDEAQNTTYEQMKMFLTRLGFGSKAVVTGDITQIDLPAGSGSGLVQARNVLGGIKGIEFVQFSDQDVIRHHLVARIIKAYDEYDLKQKKQPKR